MFYLAKTSINSAKTKAENILSQSQANQQLLNDRLKNIDNTSFSPLTFNTPNFSNSAVYDSSWATYTYVSKNPKSSV